jgi:hypothetical protein
MSLKRFSPPVVMIDACGPAAGVKLLIWPSRQGSACVTEERDGRSWLTFERAEPRRDVLVRLAGCVLLPGLAACADHDVTNATAAVRPAGEQAGTMTLAIDQTTGGAPIGPGYAGFSYEKSSLGTGFFTGSNRALVRLFRRLGTSLLRLGGNSVDRISWRDRAIGPDDVDALARFLQATGWSVLYGINLATNTPDAAADEAAYVARSLGRHLYAFEIGNEPDAYASNGLRPPSYTYGDFIRQWNAFAGAVRQAAPRARLTGPASAWHETSWTVPFARDEGAQIILLTQHYYRANGLSLQSTLALLLDGDPALPGLLDPLRTASVAAGIKDGYRLTEANSFYDGGAPHISNTFGTALWAIDFLFANARLGSSGVNFHGGGESPGYTPIADDGRAVVGVRPEYYGMLLFSFMGAGHLLSLSQSPSEFAVSAYAVAAHGRTCVMLVNKEPSAKISVDITPGMDAKAVAVMTLSAPALDSVSGIALDGASIRPDGSWRPCLSATASVSNGRVNVTLNPVSAVLLTIT